MTKRKSLHLTADLLEDILQLKEGILIRGLEINPANRTIKIIIESETFEDVPDGSESPPVKAIEDVIKQKSTLILAH